VSSAPPSPASSLRARALNRVRRVHRGLGKLAVYTMPRFGRWQATVSRAWPAVSHAHAVCERGLRPMAGQAGSGPRCSSLFGTVARPQQAERALCAWAEVGFGTEAV
jgi:hypothetical protein